MQHLHPLKNSANTQIILASSSKYRQALLKRLSIEALCLPPNIDETPIHLQTEIGLVFETAQQTAIRLAHEKALHIAQQLQKQPSDTHQYHIIIGSDQVLLQDGVQLGKPMNHANAVQQLQGMRGKTVIFYTALSMILQPTNQNQESASNNMHHFQACVPTHVELDNYSDAFIQAYLQHEQPYDCAGSAKSEGMGISLMQKMQSDDPTALIGLPLIAVCTGLRQFNYHLL